jgi:subtilisin-like proprotein convertase family protein
MKKIFTLICTAAAFYTQAQTYSSTGSVAIADGTGSCGSMGAPAVSGISVPLVGTIGTPADVTINVSINHAYVGDLGVELVAPDASSCFLLNHIGATVCDGYSGTLPAASILSFNSAFTTPVPTTINPVPGGNYAPTGSVAFPSACDLAAFLTGKSVAGAWSLRVRDHFGSFTGSIISWDMVFGSTALPLDLLSFTGNTYKGYNALRWESGLEQSISTIILERSTNGQGFEKISTFLPQGNYSHYAHNDQVDFSGIALYRLRIVEHGGKTNYSTVLKLMSSTEKKNIATTSPNPVKNNVILMAGGDELIGTTAQLLNTMGQTLQQVTISNLNHNIDMSAYPPAVYLIKLANGDILKFVKKD